jgi:hypothetical protein
MSVQTSYSESMRKSLPGVVEGCDFDADTGLVETVAGHRVWPCCLSGS